MTFINQLDGWFEFASLIFMQPNKLLLMSIIEIAIAVFDEN